MSKITFLDGTFDTRDKFLMTAATFEETGVSADRGQVPPIMSGDVLGAASSIAGIESRHAAIIAALLGGKPIPNPIEQPQGHAHRAGRRQALSQLSRPDAGDRP
ncbi:MAG: ferritin-like domain-containing protein [Pseudonocardia sp.]|nr:ferritin-like domain-containing protein [Pseudonocardia sp.]